MEHVGTKEIVPYQLYVPLLEVLLYNIPSKLHVCRRQKFAFIACCRRGAAEIGQFFALSWLIRVFLFDILDKKYHCQNGRQTNKFVAERLSTHRTATVSILLFMSHDAFGSFWSWFIAATPIFHTIFRAELVWSEIDMVLCQSHSKLWAAPIANHYLFDLRHD